MRKHRRKMGAFELEDSLFEQIVWRRTQVMQQSPECWKTGVCKICGCDILGKTMEDRACSITEQSIFEREQLPCYPEMMSTKEWEDYKVTNNIKLFN